MTAIPAPRFVLSGKSHWYEVDPKTGKKTRVRKAYVDAQKNRAEAHPEQKAPRRTEIKRSKPATVKWNPAEVERQLLVESKNTGAVPIAESVLRLTWLLLLVKWRLRPAFLTKKSDADMRPAVHAVARRMELHVLPGWNDDLFVSKGKFRRLPRTQSELGRALGYVQLNNMGDLGSKVKGDTRQLFAVEWLLYRKDGAKLRPYGKLWQEYVLADSLHAGEELMRPALERLKRGVKKRDADKFGWTVRAGIYAQDRASWATDACECQYCMLPF